MRIWSLHPKHLDRVGLVALWRETLLAQAILAGKTVGYKNHPQLIRFRQNDTPLKAVGAYLMELHVEASARGYKFDKTKILFPAGTGEIQIPVNTGQLAYEWQHLGAKLAVRAKQDYLRWQVEEMTSHPIFFPLVGEIAEWEKV